MDINRNFQGLIRRCVPNPPQGWKPKVEVFCAFLIFILASVYLTFPLIFHMTDYMNGETVIAWIMNWNIHAITNLNWDFFDANIFFPYHNTLAYSDLHLISSIIALPFFFIIHETILPSNFTFLTSLIFLGFFTYLLAFYLTKNFFASIISGLLVIFSPVILDKRYHLQVLAIEWIPLSLLFFFMFINSRKYKFLLISLIFFVIQTYNAVMPGYFLLFSYFGILITYFFLDVEKISTILTKKTFLLFIISFLFIIPITIPYFQVSRQFHFVRDIRETIHLALQPEDLLVTNEYSRLKPVLWFFDYKRYPSTVETKAGFLGGIFTILVIISIRELIIKIRQKNKQNVPKISFWAIGIFGLILSFGPALHIGRHTIHHPFLIPLPYALFYYLFPGFQGIRDSSRFEILFLLSIAIVIGISLNELLKNKKTALKFLIYAILILGIVLEIKPINYEKAYTFEKFPLVYSWIAKNTPLSVVILELPVYNWDNNPLGESREDMREYFSTTHFRRLISGGSGFSPPPWQEFAKYEFSNFPSKLSIMRIKKYGANYLIVHADEFDALNKMSYQSGDHTVYSSSYILSTLSKNQSLRFIIRKGEAYVYKFK